ncbi:MAG: type I-E CRISPR-associated protein Cas5/CasD [Pseudomonadota bacterium]
MTDYALMEIYGPMASWGEIAVGEIRATATRPSRSAIIGLLGAALGVERDDQNALQFMVDAYRFAVQVDNQGTLIRDFHTWQVPKRKKGVKWETRKEELEAEEIGTGLSRRDYCCDAVYIVCLWSVVDNPPFTLQAIKQAVERPRYVLYLGRKSCPPGLPVTVTIVSAESVREAFSQARMDAPEDLLEKIRGKKPLFFWDDAPHIGMLPQDTFTRRDVPLNRRAWQFTERHEHFGRSGREEGA